MNQRNIATDPELTNLVQRIITLEIEKREAADGIKDIFAEATSKGHSVKALRLVVKRQLESEEKKRERLAVEEEAELIEARCGQLKGTPLYDAAMTRAAE